MIQAGKKSTFSLSIMETVETIMLYSYKELSNDIILFELHKAREVWSSAILDSGQLRDFPRSWSAVEEIQAALGQLFD